VNRFLALIILLTFAVGEAQAAAPGDAAAAISAYRREHGLPAVTTDARLTQLAQEQAQAMAHAGVMDHSVAAPFSTRIARYDAAVAAENIAAGTHDFASTFVLWKESPGHNANLLRSGVTRIGIASAEAPQTRYKIYWALILARPDDHSAKVARARPDTGHAVKVVRSRPQPGLLDILMKPFR
jgi:uncharacterized protein YkwD